MWPPQSNSSYLIGAFVGCFLLVVLVVLTLGVKAFILQQHTTVTVGTGSTVTVGTLSVVCDTGTSELVD